MEEIQDKQASQSKYKLRENCPPLLKPSSGPLKSPLKRSKLNFHGHLRQNYIVNRDNNFILSKNQAQKIISSPKFHRFISLKKTSNVENLEKIINTMSTVIKSNSPHKSVESRFNRRQIHFMRLRRPNYNSPLKKRILQQQNHYSSQTQIANNLKQDSIIAENKEENSLMIKEMVTHMSQHETENFSPHIKNLKNEQYKYYLSEITTNFNNKNSIQRQHILDSMGFLQILAKYSNPQNLPKIKPICMPKDAKYRDKITVVFDLDQTLVHCFQDITSPHQIELEVMFSGGYKMIAPLNIRPRAREILKQLSQEFQLIVFTASHESYAEMVINYLDPSNDVIQYCLSRNDCQYISEGYYVKDLRLLGRDLSKVVLVDNAAYSYCFQVDNGIPILPYYAGKDDNQLSSLTSYLHGLKGDVRQINRKHFKLRQYMNYSQVESLVEALYQ